MARKAKQEPKIEQETENQFEETEFEEEAEETEEAEEKVDPVYESIKAAFVEAVDAEKDEDGIKMAMIGGGAKFKNVAFLYNKLLVELGFAKSKEEKREILDDILSGLDLTDIETFDDAILAIAERVEISEKSASAMLRQWAKKNEVEYHKPERAAPQSNISSKIYDWILSNIDSDIADFLAYVSEVGTENTMRNKNFWVSQFNFAKKIKAQYVS